MISILTPFKNAAPYFETCIESIIKQSFTDWQLILIDDFSEDESYQIASEFAQKDKRIQLIKNHKSGLIHALRNGYQLVKGEFITRMDADDIMPVNKLEVLLHHLLSKGKGHLAIGKVKYFSDNTLGEGYLFYEKWLNQLTENGTNYTEIYKECVIPSPNFLINKSDFDAIGGFTSDIYPEDYDLAFRMYKNKIKVIPCNEVTHFWRDHPTRSTRTQEHYKILNFIPLKVSNFLEIDFDKEKKLVVWGAAKKGKLIAQNLIHHNIQFSWVTENPQRIGHNVYGVIIENVQNLNENEQIQVIIAVSNKSEQRTIVDHLESKNLRNNEGYFMFF